MIPFIKSYEEKEKKEIEKNNYLSWINGIYVSHAVANVLSENAKYPDKPFPLFENKDNEESKSDEAELFDAYAAMFNKEFEEKTE
ncbi:hypothetical protein DW687_08255 [Anaerofustis stercorihominis]|uniref:Uncharacterized protein n=2 Tax=Anaerofustis stercorihominis TaxID=214853 RepID=A0A3E3DWY0_9FIRM|nr:hypothetical protein DW687_08255 [Anaerofustis stercorihominis]